jgi:hypothetical protein
VSKEENEPRCIECGDIVYDENPDPSEFCTRCES